MRRFGEAIGIIIGIFVILVSILSLIAIAKLCIKFLFLKNEVVTEDYTVCAGQTLWDIALENKKEGTDTREYIYELRKINNIDDCIIHEGQVIKIIK